MSKRLTKIFISALLLIISVVCALPAQTMDIRFVLKASDRALFRENIKGFKPDPTEDQGDIILFKIATQASFDTFCLQLLDHFRQRSFLLVSIDSVFTGQGNYPIANPATPENEGQLPMTKHPMLRALTLGPMMHWVSLRAGAGFEHENWLGAAGFRARSFTDKPLHHESVLKLQQDLLEQAENNGYPFATVWLDSVEIREDGSVFAILQIDKKRLFVFKTLKINGDLKLPKAFLPNYLGLKPGTPYSRTRVLRLREQLRSLVFLEQTLNPSVTFSGNFTPLEGLAKPRGGSGEATVNLFLKKKRASKFDFIIGLLPQPASSNSKILLTGSLSAAFQNALNLGERFSAELERLRPETQKIDLQAGVPYILGSTFGAEARLGIFRRDSTWTEAQGEAGISYLLAGADFVRFFWEKKTSTLQKVDTMAILASRELPSILDYKQNGFGVETAFSHLDYRFNPRKGWSLTVKAAAGFITVRPNAQIENLHDPDDPEFSFSTLYDSVSGREARYRTELRGEAFVPVFVRNTIKLALRGGIVFSEKSVLANENYRLGGNKLLRGFDEESLSATRFVVGTAEWRLLIGDNSFLAAFADWGYLEDRTSKDPTILRPVGLGVGLNFDTKAGIFAISAAVGRHDIGQSVDFRATKIHLGYVSLF